jgi:hypothetical protein
LIASLIDERRVWSGTERRRREPGRSEVNVCSCSAFTSSALAKERAAPPCWSTGRAIEFHDGFSGLRNALSTRADYSCGYVSPFCVVRGASTRCGGSRIRRSTDLQRIKPVRRAGDGSGAVADAVLLVAVLDVRPHRGGAADDLLGDPHPGPLCAPRRLRGAERPVLALQQQPRAEFAVAYRSRERHRSATTRLRPCALAA